MLKKLQQIYATAPDDVLEKMAILANKHGLDPTTIQMIAYEAEDGWRFKISRHGYRKIAESQPDYLGHDFFSLYRGDRVRHVPGENISIDFVNDARDNNSLIGAIGVVRRKDSLSVVKISYQDYVGQKHAWDPINGRPDTMLQKEAEVLSIRKAYAHLFWDSEAEDRDVPEEFVGDFGREDKLIYIRENQYYLSDIPKKALDKMTSRELQIIVDDIKKQKEKNK